MKALRFFLFLRTRSRSVFRLNLMIIGQGWSFGEFLGLGRRWLLLMSCSVKGGWTFKTSLANLTTAAVVSSSVSLTPATRKQLRRPYCSRFLVYQSARLIVIQAILRMCPVDSKITNGRCNGLSPHTVITWANGDSVYTLGLLHWQSYFAPRWQHDDVIKWKHFSRYWPFVRGIRRSPANSLHKGQWRGALMFSLICASTNGWINNRDAGDLIRHRAHYDAILMWETTIKLSMHGSHTTMISWLHNYSQIEQNHHHGFFIGYTVRPLKKSRTLVGNKIVGHVDVVGASPVGVAPTTSSFST